MAGWGGFSEEDLHRLKKDNSSTESQGREETEEKPENIRKVNINTGTRRTKPREKIKSKTAPKKNTREKQNASGNLEKYETCQETEFETENSTPECERNIIDQEAEKDIKLEQDIGSEICDSKENVPEIIIEPERIQAIELSALEKMQQKQKEIEDQNKLKKAALQETIRTRFRKTQAEAQVLKVVQKELAHLDSLLSADVAVLRNTIEEATRDYHHATKRYERAEAEFVEAKIELHRKTERKELLTEHLYAVIQQNEQRKAKKLEELMAKLNLSENEIQAEDIKHDEDRLSAKSKPMNENEKENESELKTIKMDDGKQVCGKDVKGEGEINGIKNENEKGKRTEREVKL